MLVSEILINHFYVLLCYNDRERISVFDSVHRKSKLQRIWKGCQTRGWRLPFIKLFLTFAGSGFHMILITNTISSVELPIILPNSFFALLVRFFTSGRSPIFSTPFFTPPKNVSQPKPISARITKMISMSTIHPINKNYFPLCML